MVVSTDGVTYTFPNTTDSGGFDWDNIKDNFENDVLIEEDKKDIHPSGHQF